MGKGRVLNAKKYSLYSLYIVVGHLVITIIPVYCLKNEISNIFAVNDDV